MSITIKISNKTFQHTYRSSKKAIQAIEGMEESPLVVNVNGVSGSFKTKSDAILHIYECIKVDGIEETEILPITVEVGSLTLGFDTMDEAYAFIENTKFQFGDDIKVSANGLTQTCHDKKHAREALITLSKLPTNTTESKEHKENQKTNNQLLVIHIGLC